MNRALRKPMTDTSHELLYEGSEYLHTQPVADPNNLIHLSVPSWRRAFNIPVIIDEAVKSGFVGQIDIWYDNPNENPNGHDTLLAKYKGVTHINGVKVNFIYRPGQNVMNRYDFALDDAPENCPEYCASIDDDMLYQSRHWQLIYSWFRNSKYMLGAPRGETLIRANEYGETYGCKVVGNSQALVPTASYFFRRQMAKDCLYRIIDHAKSNLAIFDDRNGEDAVLGFANYLATGAGLDIIPFSSGVPISGTGKTAEVPRCWSAYATGVSMSCSTDDFYEYRVPLMNLLWRFVRQSAETEPPNINNVRSNFVSDMKTAVVHPATLKLYPVDRIQYYTTPVRTRPVRFEYPPAVAEQTLWSDSPWCDDIPIEYRERILAEM